MRVIAPEYPPATNYRAPRGAPFKLALDRISVSALMADPEAWAIVTSAMPAIGFVVKAPGVDKLLDNMTVLDFGVFGIAPAPEAIAAVNARLAMLPAHEGWR